MGQGWGELGGSAGRRESAYDQALHTLQNPPAWMQPEEMAGTGTSEVLNQLGEDRVPLGGVLGHDPDPQPLIWSQVKECRSH